jgi:hypothetical protein
MPQIAVINPFLKPRLRALYEELRRAMELDWSCHAQQCNCASSTERVSGRDDERTDDEAAVAVARMADGLVATPRHAFATPSEG